MSEITCPLLFHSLEQLLFYEIFSKMKTEVWFLMTPTNDHLSAENLSKNVRDTLCRILT